jgi:hypothetical protein
MNHHAIDWLGWTATAVFVGSYFFKRPVLLRIMQMAGALLWILYGVLIGATPVIVANILVFGAAAWTTLRRSAVTGTDAALGRDAVGVR